jgi:hypothetical protein
VREQHFANFLNPPSGCLNVFLIETEKFFSLLFANEFKWHHLGDFCTKIEMSEI